MQTLTALKNLKSQKLFILVNEKDGRLRLVADNGEVMSLPSHLFAPESIEVAAEEFSKHFSAVQIASYEKQLGRLQEQAEKDAQNLPYISAKSTSSSTARTRKPSSTAAGPARSLRTPREATNGSAAGRMVSWNSPKLTFYRNKIHDLRPQDRFKISIEGEGDFVISREEFEKFFGEVLVSPDYKSQGLFTYASIPEKARRFIRA